MATHSLADNAFNHDPMAKRGCDMRDACDICLCSTSELTLRCENKFYLPCNLNSTRFTTSGIDSLKVFIEQNLFTKLDSVGVRLFRNQKFAELNIRYNHALSAIEPKIFWKMNVQKLNIAGNIVLTKLHRGLFSGMTVDELYIRNNKMLRHLDQGSSTEDKIENTANPGEFNENHTENVVNIGSSTMKNILNEKEMSLERSLRNGLTEVNHVWLEGNQLDCCGLEFLWSRLEDNPICEYFDNTPAGSADLKKPFAIDDSTLKRENPSLYGLPADAGQRFHLPGEGHKTMYPGGATYRQFSLDKTFEEFNGIPADLILVPKGAPKAKPVKFVEALREFRSPKALSSAACFYENSVDKCDTTARSNAEKILLGEKALFNVAKDSPNTGVNHSYTYDFSDSGESFFIDGIEILGESSGNSQVDNEFKFRLALVENEADYPLGFTELNENATLTKGTGCRSLNEGCLWEINPPVRAQFLNLQVSSKCGPSSSCENQDYIADIRLRLVPVPTKSPTPEPTDFHQYKVLEVVGEHHRGEGGDRRAYPHRGVAHKSGDGHGFFDAIKTALEQKNDTLKSNKRSIFDNSGERFAYPGMLEDGELPVSTATTDTARHVKYLDTKSVSPDLSGLGLQDILHSRGVICAAPDTSRFHKPGYTEPVGSETYQKFSDVPLAMDDTVVDSDVLRARLSPLDYAKIKVSVYNHYSQYGVHLPSKTMKLEPYEVEVDVKGSRSNIPVSKVVNFNSCWDSSGDEMLPKPCKKENKNKSDGWIMEAGYQSGPEDPENPSLSWQPKKSQTIYNGRFVNVGRKQGKDVSAPPGGKGAPLEEYGFSTSLTNDRGEVVDYTLGAIALALLPEEDYRHGINLTWNVDPPKVVVDKDPCPSGLEKTLDVPCKTVSGNERYTEKQAKRFPTVVSPRFASDNACSIPCNEVKIVKIRYRLMYNGDIADKDHGQLLYDDSSAFWGYNIRGEYHRGRKPTADELLERETLHEIFDEYRPLTLRQQYAKAWELAKHYKPKDKIVQMHPEADDLRKEALRESFGMVTFEYNNWMYANNKNPEGSSVKSAYVDEGYRQLDQCDSPNANKEISICRHKFQIPYHIKEKVVLGFSIRNPRNHDAPRTPVMDGSSSLSGDPSLGTYSRQFDGFSIPVKKVSTPTIILRNTDGSFRAPQSLLSLLRDPTIISDDFRLNNTYTSADGDDSKTYATDSSSFSPKDDDVSRLVGLSDGAPIMYIPSKKAWRATRPLYRQLLNCKLSAERYEDELELLENCLYGVELKNSDSDVNQLTRKKSVLNKQYMLSVSINDYYTELDFPQHPKFPTNETRANETKDYLANMNSDHKYNNVGEDDMSPESKAAKDHRKKFVTCLKRCDDLNARDSGTPAKLVECKNSCRAVFLTEGIQSKETLPKSDTEAGRDLYDKGRH